MKKLISILCLVLLFSCNKDEPNYGSITDIEGNVYTSVTIGTQVWMVENLKTTKYNDGTAIPNITDNTEWKALTTGAYSDYDYTPSNSFTYGRLYNWYTVGTDKLCPTGWHVPSDAEWIELTDYLGGEDAAGGKLKETGTTHWEINTGATNETGFTALPSGYRSYDGTFSGIEITCYWWSSNEYSTAGSYFWNMYYTNTGIGRSSHYKECGFSVRCIKNN